MKKPDDPPGSYVRKVHEETQRYTQELLAENDRLRVLVATLENERARLEETVRSERVQLERQVAEVEKESRRFREQYDLVEAQNSNLANLYVASYRLHGTLDRKEVLAAIQEIVINLIGSEELGLYEMANEGRSLRLVESFGINAAEHAIVPVGAGRIGRTAAAGEADIGPNAGGDARAEEANLSACIPLKIDGRVTGVLALFRLLPQKSGFEAIDHELFGLLATHAATALYCTRLQEHAEGCPA